MLCLPLKAFSSTSNSSWNIIVSRQLVDSRSHKVSPKLNRDGLRPLLPREPDGQGPPPGLPLEFRLFPVMQPFEPPCVFPIFKLCLAAPLCCCFASVILDPGRGDIAPSLCSVDAEAKGEEQECDKYDYRKDGTHCDARYSPGGESCWAVRLCCGSRWARCGAQ